MKQIKSPLFILSLFFFFMPGQGCKKDNTIYKPVDTKVLLLMLDDVRTRVEQYDLGDMTPMDAKFSKLYCGSYGKGDDPLIKEIEILDSMIVDGIIKTVQFGNIYVSLHGSNSYGSSGLYDGTVTKPGYYYNDMEQQFYMTDHQVDRVLDYLKSKTE